MARWKFSRISYGNEEFKFLEGDEISLGRGINNNISLSSIVVSRNHCSIKVQEDNVLITDLKSSNGIYVGLKKIPPNVPFSLEDSDIIGIGWTRGAPVANIKDNEKYMFKLTKEKPQPVTSRLRFQSDNEGDIECAVAAIDGLSNSNLTPPKLSDKQSPRKLSLGQNNLSETRQSPVFNGKPAVKRKIYKTLNKFNVKTEGNTEYKIDENVISILSDSESEQETISKKSKLEPEKPPLTISETDIKTEKDNLEYDAFKVKQEYLGYDDDEPIQIDSDSDIESANWYMRLSQSSPAKPLIKATRESRTNIENEESSYSQIDDFEEDFMDDLITIIPPEPLGNSPKQSPDSGLGDKTSEPRMVVEDEEEYLEDPISLHRPEQPAPKSNEKMPMDVLDGSSKTVPEVPISNSTITAEFYELQNLQTADKKVQEAESSSDPETTVIASDTSSNKKKALVETAVIASETSENKKKDLVIDACAHSQETAVIASETSENKKKALVIDACAHPQETAVIALETSENKKKALLIEACAHPLRSKSTATDLDSKHKNLSSTSKHSKDRNRRKHSSSSRRHITDSQKEERKRKLKDIASKEKEDSDKRSSKQLNSSKDKSVVNAKVTSSNRGAFLTDVVQGVVKPMKRKESPQKSGKSKDKDQKSSNMLVTKESQDSHNESSKGALVAKKPIHDIENKRKTEKHNSSKQKEKETKSVNHKKKAESSKAKSTNGKSNKSISEARIPLESLKPFSGKPFSIVEPMPNVKRKRKEKKNKSVSFSDNVSVIYFEIEEGNNIKKKTSMVKTTLLDSRQKPVFSLEKIFLMKILRWNPQWLEEQMNNNDPPPILGNNHPPMAVLHTFSNHNQYVAVVGDLLLMEIWECLTQGYMRARNQSSGIEMRIASLPPVSSQDRCFELFNLSVNVSVPNNEVKTVPRMGEVILITFGPENTRYKRFFYVHNVRTLPSPQNNKFSFFCISLFACYTDKMKSLKPGELMIGLTLSHIHKELSLFEAMEHLAFSPLREAILKPEQRDFAKCDPNAVYPQSEWTQTLNPSQQMAVHASVSAAVGDRPSIQMVQGPPGTGKSSVICAMVMTYLFDVSGRRQPNRGKILICATSNAAVDDLVIRLLKIRQKQPKTERFRMVRVGRAEAMHPRALDISSQQLAKRDAGARHHAEPAQPAHPARDEEISHLEAKINMWKTQEQDAKDPVRAAYCKGRVKALIDRMAMIQGGGGPASGGQLTGEQFAAIERRIIEGADVIVTTLSSALNPKMRGLRHRIALCIVDEAGQAIEPETLIPLTLDVTKLALIGDPQQLPGFICSQRAKKLGLGESLFYRLTSCAEQWGDGSPVILLNQQYRMQPEIADYPNRAFYGSRIMSMPPPRPNLDIPAYSIVSITSGDKGQGAAGGNEMEAWGVARLVLALQASLRPLGLCLAVITPYNAHKELIKRNLRMLQDPSEGSVEVNTVDSFQGQERDVVVVSLARSQGVGFLTDAGRMNVMLTRAKHALAVCLNPQAMLKNYQWRTLIEDAQKRNLYRSLPHKICQGVGAGPIPHGDVLKHITLSKTYHK